MESSNATLCVALVNLWQRGSQLGDCSNWVTFASPPVYTPSNQLVEEDSSYIEKKAGCVHTPECYWDKYHG